MNTLELTPRETEVLVETLESFLSDLSFEIADTDSYDYREQLKDKRRVLNRILDGLKQGSPPAKAG